MPIKRLDEAAQEPFDVGRDQALLDGRAAPDALLDAQIGVAGDEPAPRRHRLRHREPAVRPYLDHKLGSAKAQVARGGCEFGRIADPSHPGARRPDRQLDESGKRRRLTEVGLHADDDRPRLRRADRVERSRSGGFVLNAAEAGEAWRDRRRGEAATPRRKHGDLLLRRENQVDPSLGRDLVGAVEPRERVGAEVRRPVDPAHVSREARKA